MCTSFMNNRENSIGGREKRSARAKCIKGLEGSRCEQANANETLEIECEPTPM